MFMFGTGEQVNRDPFHRTTSFSRTLWESMWPASAALGPAEAARGHAIFHLLLGFGANLEENTRGSSSPRGRGAFVGPLRRKAHAKVADTCPQLLGWSIGPQLVTRKSAACAFARSVWLGDFQLRVGTHEVTVRGLVSLGYTTHERE